MAVRRAAQGWPPPRDRTALRTRPRQRRRCATPGSHRPRQAVATGEAVGNSLGLFGLTLVTCERGDLRESSDGLVMYRRGQRTDVPVEDELRGAAELEELYQAVRFGAPIVHDGRWGEATLEVCLAIHESARQGTEVQLQRQTALPT